MTTIESNTEKTTKTFSEVFPFLGFFLRHLFECIAVLLTCAGIMGYAAGKSFDEGWSRAAGIQTSQFPSDTYELVLNGLSLKTPWLYAVIGVVLLLLIMNATAFADALYDYRIQLVRHRRKAYENLLSRLNRGRKVKAARKERPKAEAYMKWKLLGSRGDWVKTKEKQAIKAKKAFPFIKVVVSLGVQLAVLAIFILLYIFARNIVIKQANVEGVRDYIGMYIAVTGKLPPQYPKETMEQALFKELACEGVKSLSNYRAVNIGAESQAEVDLSSTSTYVIKATDKLVLLLGADGSRVKSFGNSAFELRESAVRPLSPTLKFCD